MVPHKQRPAQPHSHRCRADRAPGGLADVPLGDDQIVDHLLQIVRDAGTLCLDVKDPGWDNARGYLFDPDSNTLYFPVSKKYLDDRELDRYEVLIWSQPRVLVVGRLSSATSEQDVGLASKLAAAMGWEPGKIDYMLFDQRHHKPRKNRHKLLIESVRETTA